MTAGKGKLCYLRKVLSVRSQVAQPLDDARNKEIFFFLPVARNSEVTPAHIPVFLPIRHL